MEYLLDCYQGNGDFVLKETKVKFRRRDVALISGLNVTSMAMKGTSLQVPPFRERYFVGLKQVSYQNINRPYLE